MTDTLRPPRLSCAARALAALAALLPRPAFAQGKYPDRPVRDHPAVRRGRRRRHHDAAGRRQARREARPAFRGREHAGCRRHRRGARGAAIAGRRLYACGAHQRHRGQRRRCSRACRSIRSRISRRFRRWAISTLFFVNAGSPYKTLGDFIKAAKEKPGQLNVGTIAAGSSQNLGAELFKSVTGLDFRDRAVQDLGRSAGRARAQRRADGGRVLCGLARRARCQGPGRWSGGSGAVAAMPDAPTAGRPCAAFEVTSWNAIFAPAGTPPRVIATLNKALNEVLADPEVKKKALELGIDARGSTPQEIQARLKATSRNGPR